jgi:hypothetical protein
MLLDSLTSGRSVRHIEPDRPTAKIPLMNLIEWEVAHAKYFNKINYLLLGSQGKLKIH